MQADWPQVYNVIQAWQNDAVIEEFFIDDRADGRVMTLHVVPREEAKKRDGLLSPQVCERVGMTYRQLTYWVEKGYIHPSIYRATKSGEQHLFSEADVVNLSTIVYLRSLGISFDRIINMDPPERRQLATVIKEVLGE